MFKRSISVDEVETVVTTGEIIRAYAEDKPYPSCLMLGFPGGLPVHVVVSQNTTEQTCYIITTYRPAPTLWSADFKTKI